MTFKCRKFRPILYYTVAVNVQENYKFNVVLTFDDIPDVSYLSFTYPAKL